MSSCPGMVLKLVNANGTVEKKKDVRTWKEYRLISKDYIEYLDESPVTESWSLQVSIK